MTPCFLISDKYKQVKLSNTFNSMKKTHCIFTNSISYVYSNVYCINTIQSGQKFGQTFVTDLKIGCEKAGRTTTHRRKGSQPIKICLRGINLYIRQLPNYVSNHLAMCAPVSNFLLPFILFLPLTSLSCVHLIQLKLSPLTFDITLQCQK